MLIPYGSSDIPRPPIPIRAAARAVRVARADKAVRVARAVRTFPAAGAAVAEKAALTGLPSSADAEAIL